MADKIRRAANELRYRPNLQARSLSTQRTRTVALLIKRSSWHNAMMYVSAVQSVLRSRGYVETFMLHPDNRAESELEHLEICLQRSVEGILALPLIDPAGKANVEMFNRLHTEEKIPVVQLGLALPGCVAPSVIADVVKGVAKAVTLLHAMGHRRIAMATLAGFDDPNEFSPHHFSQRVYLGYRQGMASVGLPEQVFVGQAARHDVTDQFDASLPLGLEVAKAASRPTAVLAFSPYAAAGLMTGLIEQGLRVPDDVSVICSGEQPFARMMRPPLSTLEGPFEKMATAATEMLLKMIEGGEGASIAIPQILCLRDSVRELHD